jgi:hypothetical protein
MDLAEQLKYFDANCERLYERMLQEMADDRPAVIALARERLIFGMTLYGDESWHKVPDRLAMERREEHCDALNYIVMEDHQTRRLDLWEQYAQEPAVIFEPDERLARALTEYSPDD